MWTVIRRLARAHCWAKVHLSLFIMSCLAVHPFNGRLWLWWPLLFLLLHIRLCTSLSNEGTSLFSTFSGNLFFPASISSIFSAVICVAFPSLCFRMLFVRHLSFWTVLHYFHVLSVDCVLLLCVCGGVVGGSRHAFRLVRIPSYARSSVFFFWFASPSSILETFCLAAFFSCLVILLHTRCFAGACVCFQVHPTFQVVF